MLNQELLEQQLAELPLYVYHFFDPKTLEFTDRVRWICEHECPMFGTSWACPPAVGSVTQCRARCLGYKNALAIATITEVADIANIEDTLATRPDHEAVTNQVRDIMVELGAEPYVLSTEACAICERCAILDKQPCRHPEMMHPCVESHGINVVPMLENHGLEFQFGANVVTWISLFLY